jgi:hypothetical protein
VRLTVDLSTTEYPCPWQEPNAVVQPLASHFAPNGVVKLMNLFANGGDYIVHSHPSDHEEVRLSEVKISCTYGDDMKRQ